MVTWQPPTAIPADRPHLMELARATVEMRDFEFPGVFKMNGKTPKVTKDAARESLPEALRPKFDQLVKEVGEWSVYFYGSKFVSYAILAELVRSGWQKSGTQT